MGILQIDSTLKNDFIGCGSQWKVYRLFCNNGNTVVAKVPNCKQNMQQNIEAWNLLNKLSIPTTSFLKMAEWHGKKVLLTEDISYDDPLFISPNTKVVTANDNRLNSLALHHGEKLTTSKAEQDFYEHKITGEITGVDKSIQKVKENLHVLSQKGYSAFCDAYYFSASHNETFEFSYMIADWDLICKEEVTEDELYKANIEQFASAIKEYNEHFVDKSVKTIIDALNSLL